MLNSTQKRKSLKNNEKNPKILTVQPVQILEHPYIMVRIPEERNDQIIKKPPKAKEGEGDSQPILKADNFKNMNIFPILNMDWSCFSGARYLAAISALGKIF